MNSVKDRPELARLDLLALLIMPIQRIPRYKLLVDDLLRSTPPHHPDHPDLQNVARAVSYEEKRRGGGKGRKEEEREVRRV